MQVCTTMRTDFTMGWNGPVALLGDLLNNSLHPFLDGGTPYLDHWIDPTKSQFPTNSNPAISGITQTLMFQDEPGYNTGDIWWTGQQIHLLVQTFETHLVCIKGVEKGAIYGGFQWGHSFSMKPDHYLGNTINNYNVNRWCTPMNSVSPVFRRVVSRALGLP